MTTKATVAANHGWPVKVTGVKPGTLEPTGYGGVVARNEFQDFHCHSAMDLIIHEVQEGEPEFMRGNAMVQPVSGVFPMGHQVKLHLSGERGQVIGFATYLRSPPQYFVEYVAGDGRQVEGWFYAGQLVSA